MNTVPLSQYFVCNERSTEDFNTLKWLHKVGDDILAQIIESSELFFSQEEEKRPPFECFDYLTLCYLVGEKECNVDSEQLSEKVKNSCLLGLATFAHCEKMRRDGILEFKGVGRVTEFHEHNTDIELTDMGKMVRSSMKTMFEISEAVEKN